MDVYIGADYRGFEKKNHLVQFLKANGYNAIDKGAYEYHEGDDEYGQNYLRQIPELRLVEPESCHRQSFDDDEEMCTVVAQHSRKKY